jgi:transcriptional regulator with XRE-family HTH domain
METNNGRAGRRKVEPGPTSRHVAANVKRLRGARGFSLVELSKQLARIGRPILPSGLNKIEQRHRSVDVDDLMALALALGVNANALLLPPDVSAESVALTEKVSARGFRAWEWATGEAPLDAPDSTWLRLSELTEWFEMTRPHKPPEEIAAEVAAVRQRLLEHAEGTDREVKAAQQRWRGLQQEGTDNG